MLIYPNALINSSSTPQAHPTTTFGQSSHSYQPSRTSLSRPSHTTTSRHASRASPLLASASSTSSSCMTPSAAPPPQSVSRARTSRSNHCVCACVFYLRQTITQNTVINIFWVYTNLLMASVLISVTVAIEHDIYYPYVFLHPPPACDPRMMPTFPQHRNLKQTPGQPQVASALVGAPGLGQMFPGSAVNLYPQERAMIDPNAGASSKLAIGDIFASLTRR